MDSRLAALQSWVAAQLRAQSRSAEFTPEFTLVPASADASFRRYFRAELAEGGSFIAMDAPPAAEDCAPFVRVAGLLRAAGLNAPEIIGADLGQGFLLLTDLGTVTYLEALRGEPAADASALFRDAIAALLRWQLATRSGVLPLYDEALLRREMALFPEWYAARHLKKPLTPAQATALQAVEAELVRSALAQPRVYVHRDYMPRNLMVADPNPGVLDFQDAVEGPLSYDLVCLMRDAFISWEDERVLDWTVRYWEQAKRAGLPVAADFAEFWRAFEWMGLQRHLKVLGIFARLAYRDRKSAYLQDAPRFLGYARAVATRYRALAPLAKLLEELQQ